MESHHSSHKPGEKEYKTALQIIKKTKKEVPTANIMPSLLAAWTLLERAVSGKFISQDAKEFFLIYEAIETAAKQNNRPAQHFLALMLARQKDYFLGNSDEQDRVTAFLEHPQIREQFNANQGPAQALQYADYFSVQKPLVQKPLYNALCEIASDGGLPRGQLKYGLVLDHDLVKGYPLIKAAALKNIYFAQFLLMLFEAVGEDAEEARRQELDRTRVMLKMAEEADQLFRREDEFFQENKEDPREEFNIHSILSTIFNPSSTFPPDLRAFAIKEKDECLQHGLHYAQLIQAMLLCDSNPVESLSLFEQAAYQGNHHAQCVMAFLFLRANRNFSDVDPLVLEELGLKVAVKKTVVGDEVALKLIKNSQVRDALKEYDSKRSEQVARTKIDGKKVLGCQSRLQGLYCLHAKKSLSEQDKKLDKKLKDSILSIDDPEMLLAFSIRLTDGVYMPQDSALAFAALKKSNNNKKTVLVFEYMRSQLTSKEMPAATRFFSVDPDMTALRNMVGELIKNPGVVSEFRQIKSFPSQQEIKSEVNYLLARGMTAHGEGVKVFSDDASTPAARKTALQKIRFAARIGIAEAQAYACSLFGLENGFHTEEYNHQLYEVLCGSFSHVITSTIIFAQMVLLKYDIDLREKGLDSLPWKIANRLFHDEEIREHFNNTYFNVRSIKSCISKIEAETVLSVSLRTFVCKELLNIAATFLEQDPEISWARIELGCAHYVGQAEFPKNQLAARVHLEKAGENEMACLYFSLIELGGVAVIEQLKTFADKTYQGKVWREAVESQPVKSAAGQKGVDSKQTPTDDGCFTKALHHFLRPSPALKTFFDDFALKAQWDLPVLGFVKALGMVDTNPFEAYQLLEQHAVKGNIHAQYILAAILLAPEKDQKENNATSLKDQIALTLSKNAEIQARIKEKFTYPAIKKFAADLLRRHRQEETLGRWDGATLDAAVFLFLQKRDSSAEDALSDALRDVFESGTQAVQMQLMGYLIEGQYLPRKPMSAYCLMVQLCGQDHEPSLYMTNCMAMSIQRNKEHAAFSHLKNDPEYKFAKDLSGKLMSDPAVSKKFRAECEETESKKRFFLSLGNQSELDKLIDHAQRGSLKAVTLLCYMIMKLRKENLPEILDAFSKLILEEQAVAVRLLVHPISAKKLSEKIKKSDRLNHKPKASNQQSTPADKKFEKAFEIYQTHPLEAFLQFQEAANEGSQKAIDLIKLLKKKSMKARCENPSLYIFFKTYITDHTLEEIASVLVENASVLAELNVMEVLGYNVSRRKAVTLVDPEVSHDVESKESHATPPTELKTEAADANQVMSEYQRTKNDAEKGDHPSKRIIALLILRREHYFLGTADEQDRVTSFFMYPSIRDELSPEQQKNQAMQYAEYFSRMDKELSDALYEFAAERGVPLAQLHHGLSLILYSEKQNTKKAYTLIKSAALAGMPHAQYLLIMAEAMGHEDMADVPSQEDQIASEGSINVGEEIRKIKLNNPELFKTEEKCYRQVKFDIHDVLSVIFNPSGTFPEPFRALAIKIKNVGLKCGAPYAQLIEAMLLCESKPVESLRLFEQAAYQGNHHAQCVMTCLLLRAHQNFSSTEPLAVPRMTVGDEMALVLIKNSAVCGALKKYDLAQSQLVIRTKIENLQDHPLYSKLQGLYFLHAKSRLTEEDRKLCTQIKRTLLSESHSDVLFAFSEKLTEGGFIPIDLEMAFEALIQTAYKGSHRAVLILQYMRFLTEKTEMPRSNQFFRINPDVDIQKHRAMAEKLITNPQVVARLKKLEPFSDKKESQCVVDPSFSRAKKSYQEAKLVLNGPLPITDIARETVSSKMTFAALLGVPEARVEIAVIYLDSGRSPDQAYDFLRRAFPHEVAVRIIVLMMLIKLGVKLSENEEVFKLDDQRRAAQLLQDEKVSQHFDEHYFNCEKVYLYSLEVAKAFSSSCRHYVLSELLAKAVERFKSDPESSKLKVKLGILYYLSRVDLRDQGRGRLYLESASQEGNTLAALYFCLLELGGPVANREMTQFMTETDQGVAWVKQKQERFNPAEQKAQDSKEEESDDNYFTRAVNYFLHSSDELREFFDEFAFKAQFNIGVISFIEALRIVDKDPLKAYLSLEQQAVQGNVHAQYILAGLILCLEKKEFKENEENEEKEKNEKNKKNNLISFKDRIVLTLSKNSGVQKCVEKKFKNPTIKTFASDLLKRHQAGVNGETWDKAAVDSAIFLFLQERDIDADKAFRKILEEIFEKGCKAAQLQLADCLVEGRFLPKYPMQAYCLVARLCGAHHQPSMHIMKIMEKISSHNGSRLEFKDNSKFEEDLAKKLLNDSEVLKQFKSEKKNSNEEKSSENLDFDSLIAAAEARNTKALRIVCYIILRYTLNLPLCATLFDPPLKVEEVARGDELLLDGTAMTKLPAKIISKAVSELQEMYVSELKNMTFSNIPDEKVDIAYNIYKVNPQQAFQFIQEAVKGNSKRAKALMALLEKKALTAGRQDPKLYLHFKRHLKIAFESKSKEMADSLLDDPAVLAAFNAEKVFNRKAYVGSPVSAPVASPEVKGKNEFKMAMAMLNKPTLDEREKDDAMKLLQAAVRYGYGGREAKFKLALLLEGEENELIALNLIIDAAKENLPDAIKVYDRLKSACHSQGDAKQQAPDFAPQLQGCVDRLFQNDKVRAVLSKDMKALEKNAAANGVNKITKGFETMLVSDSKQWFAQQDELLKKRNFADPKEKAVNITIEAALEIFYGAIRLDRGEEEVRKIHVDLQQFLKTQYNRVLASIEHLAGTVLYETRLQSFQKGYDLTLKILSEDMEKYVKQESEVEERSGMRCN